MRMVSLKPTLTPMALLMNETMHSVFQEYIFILGCVVHCFFHISKKKKSMFWHFFLISYNTYKTCVKSVSLLNNLSLYPVQLWPCMEGHGYWCTLWVKDQTVQINCLKCYIQQQPEPNASSPTGSVNVKLTFLWFHTSFPSKQINLETIFN